jgi:hypothetical protein
MKSVYTLTKNSSGHDFWMRVGTCIVQKDGTEKMTLFALPVSGILILRAIEPLKDNEEMEDAQ